MTITQSPPTPTLDPQRGGEAPAGTTRRSRRHLAGWLAVGAGVVAAGALAVVALADGEDPAPFRNHQLVAERGSITAIDHAATQRAPGVDHTGLYDRGSIVAIERATRR